MKIQARTLRIVDYRAGRTYTPRNKQELYSIAFDLSLRERAAVYISPRSTVNELIDDIMDHARVEYPGQAR